MVGDRVVKRRSRLMPEDQPTSSLGRRADPLTTHEREIVTRNSPDGSPRRHTDGYQSGLVTETLTSPPSDVTIDGRSIALVWPDGRSDAFPFAWLRDSCACAQCRHPGSGQRLLEPSTIPLDIHPAELRYENDCLLGALAGEVTAHSFLGAVTRVTIAAQNGSELIANVPSTGAQSFSVKQRVLVRFPSESARVLDA
jgi:Gamma-butyrobetaine hydroxylase-like, N-terminal/TOBE domain